MKFKYKLKGSTMGFSNILETILINRGIINIKDFLNPSKKHMENILLYDNVEKAYNCLRKHLDNNSYIVILVDCDADGYTSASFMYQYIKIIKPDTNISYIIHDDKKHGLDKVTMEKLLNTKCNLLIIPDAGSSNYIEHYYLNKRGIDIIVLDHHECDRYSFSAIVINNQLSKKVTNKSITGVGIVYKFCKYIDEQLGLNKADDFLDLVSVGMIGDVCDLKNLESRYLVLNGIEQIQREKNKNKFISALIKEKSYSLKSDISIIGIAFYITPLINAIVRNGTYEQKKMMFEAFLNSDEKYMNKIRGKGEVELSAQEHVVRIGKKCKEQQTSIIEKCVVKIKEQIENYKLNEHGIIVVNGTEVVERNYNGLVANKIASIYQRPCMVLSDDSKNYSGSARGYENKDIKNLQEWCKKSNLFSLVAGHKNAFGLSIPRSNIEQLYTVVQDIKVSDTLLYEVDGIFNEKSISKVLIESVSEYHNIWGTTVEEPLFAIENITINTAYIDMIGTKGNKIRFDCNDIICVLYNTNKEFFDSIKQHSAINMTIIGRFSIGENKGNKISQIIIEDMTYEPILLQFKF